jgi:anti-sigma-K factor RskA
MNYQAPPLGDLLAAEYVIGTLKGRARQRFERLLQAHPELQHRVREWEQRFPRALGLPPSIKPPSSVWQHVEQRLFAAPASVPWFQRLAFWRNLALGSSLLAGVLAIMLLLIPRPETPHYVAVISSAEQQPLWLVSSSPGGQEIYAKNMKPLEVPQGKRCFLWLKASQSQAVYPVGTLPENGEAVILPVAGDLHAVLPGRVLVTLEDLSQEPPSQPSHLLEFQGQWLPLIDS